MTKPNYRWLAGHPYYPRDREDALKRLRMSTEALDKGDEATAQVLHKYARAYINDHLDEFPEYDHAKHKS